MFRWGVQQGDQDTLTCPMNGPTMVQSADSLSHPLGHQVLLLLCFIPFQICPPVSVLADKIFNQTF